MNKTKRLLIIFAVVFNFVAVALSIGAIIWSSLGIESLYKMMGVAVTEAELAVIVADNIFTASLDILLNLASAICLIIMLKLYEKNFVVSRRLYIAGLVLNILSSPFSIATILLFVSYFVYMDIKATKDPDGNEPDVEIIPSEEEVKAKIEKLRKLKEEGVITEEEYNAEIMKLL